MNRCDHADPVDEILAACGVSGPWQRLEATGVANRTYATQDLVLRVATDYPDAVVDARTESIAAPAAREAGILTRRLAISKPAQHGEIVSGPQRISGYSGART